MRFLWILFPLVVLAPNVTAELPTWKALADRGRWAANAHNVQSWRLAEVAGRPDQRRLVLDPSRLLPETDPPARQLTLSLGAFLAVLETEAAANGAAVRWEPLADEPGALATLEPHPSTPPPDGWVDALTAPTVKYRTTPLAFSAPERNRMAEGSTETVRIAWVTAPDEVAAAKVWAQGAFDLEMDLPRTRDESIRVTRYGEPARKAQPWGITLVPNFTEGTLFWVETFASWFPQSPVEYARSAKAMMSEALTPVQQILVVTSRGNGNRERLEAGIVVQRLWLEVRAAGGELLPLSQGLQEFAEMAPWYDEAHRRWAARGETVQMVLAVFRPAAGRFLASPRLDAEGILR